jgi:cytochrome oxidase assembly protein ShyY1
VDIDPDGRLVSAPVEDPRRWLRWTGYVAVAILFAIACAFLSNWQFGRNTWRSDQLSLISNNYDATPVSLDAVLAADGSLDPAKQWQPISVRGTYDVAEQVVARNRINNGTTGFEVLTPLTLDDGRVLIIDRGWVPPAATGDGPSTIPAPPSGEVTVIARAQPSEALPSGRGTITGQVPSINLPLVAATTGSETYTGLYGLMVSEDPAAASVPTPLAAPDNDPGPYLSYAIQWIMFAVMGFGFIGYVIRTEIRKRRGLDRTPDDDEEDDDGIEYAPRKRRRSDAEIEDELLDHAGA